MTEFQGQLAATYKYNSLGLITLEVGVTLKTGQKDVISFGFYFRITFITFYITLYVTFTGRCSQVHPGDGVGTSWSQL